MTGEFPSERRCCFCLLLQRGLLAWGYFKTIADAFFVFLISYLFIDALSMIRLFAKEDHVSHFYTELVISMIALTLFFTDFIVTVLFIIGGHKKNMQLIRVFYFLSLGIWVATYLLASFTVIMTIKNYFTFNDHYFMLRHTVMATRFYFVVLAMQTYIILVLRSEYTKLRNIGEFRFVHNAAKAECTMLCEEVIV